MLSKTAGIVLNHIKFKESSIIVRIFTKDFGLKSYIVNGVRSAKGKNKIALYQPLTLLDLVVYEKNSKGISRLSEARCNAPFSEIPLNIYKSSIAIFIEELLSKIIQEDYIDEELFFFIKDSIIQLDQIQEGIGDFHIIFLFRLIQVLGLDPIDIEHMYYQVRQSQFQHLLPEIRAFNLVHYNDVQIKKYGESLQLNSSERSNFIQLLITYLKCNFEDLSTIKSLAVLKEIFQA